MTQREVAARAGVQQSVVSAYESGGREPSLTTLSSLVEACGVSLEVHLGEALPAGAGPDAVGPVGRRLRRRRAAVLAIAGRHGMTDLRVFGSVARGQDTDGSDLGLLMDPQLASSSEATAVWLAKPVGPLAPDVTAITAAR